MRLWETFLSCLLYGDPCRHGNDSNSGCSGNRIHYILSPKQTWKWLKLYVNLAWSRMLLEKSNFINKKKKTVKRYFIFKFDFFLYGRDFIYLLICWNQQTSDCPNYLDWWFFWNISVILVVHMCSRGSLTNWVWSFVGNWSMSMSFFFLLVICWLCGFTHSW